MMNKQELITSMEKATGTTFITRLELADFLHLKDPKSVDAYLFGLPSINKRYFVPDVADTIIENMKWR